MHGKHRLAVAIHTVVSGLSVRLGSLAVLKVVIFSALFSATSDILLLTLMSMITEAFLDGDAHSHFACSLDHPPEISIPYVCVCVCVCVRARVVRCGCVGVSCGLCVWVCALCVCACVCVCVLCVRNLD